MERRTLARNYCRRLAKAATIVCSVFASAVAPPVWAKGGSAIANGSVVIVKPVGTGVAFDTITSALSGAFLSGEPGDAVSLLLPEQRRPARLPVEVMVLSTSSFDLGGALVPSATLVTADGSFPVRLIPVGIGQGGGNLLFLAQFN